jgi:dipeptidyl aminopeptidase/acylaminoacyl peptidase
VHFATTAGAPAGRVLPIEPVSLPTAMAWSPDGSRLALVNLPGRAAAEVWLLTVADGSLRRLQHFAAPAELDGITWSSDGKALLIGRRDFESEVLLLRVVK